MLSPEQYQAALKRAEEEAKTHSTGLSAGVRRAWWSATENMLILDRDWSSFHPSQHQYILMGLLGAYTDFPGFHSENGGKALNSINQRRISANKPEMTQEELDNAIDALVSVYVADVKFNPEPVEAPENPSVNLDLVKEKKGLFSRFIEWVMSFFK